MENNFPGNIAIGSNTKLGPTVANLNRNPIETCPGSSEWCEKQCYARRGHFTFWKDLYRQPIEIPDAMPRLMRLHSSGDFDTVEYTRWIRGIIEDNKETTFWAYTRSWRVDELLDELEMMRDMENVTIFASMDVSIEEKPPDGWRIAWVENDPRAEGTFCPHDAGKVETCMECGLCYNGKSEEDIIFKKK